MSDSCRDDVTSYRQTENVAMTDKGNGKRWRRNIRNKAVLRLSVDVRVEWCRMVQNKFLFYDLVNDTVSSSN